MQHRLLAINDKGMPGIMAALEAHHDADLIGQQINNLTLPLVTLLGAKDDYILTHYIGSYIKAG